MLLRAPEKSDILSPNMNTRAQYTCLPEKGCFASFRGQGARVEFFFKKYTF